MSINLIRHAGQGPGEDLPRVALHGTSRIEGTILLDERVGALREPLAEAGFEVLVIPSDQRGTIPMLKAGKDTRLPILITGKVGDWLDRNPDPMSMGVSLINVAAILGHPERCATLLLRTLADPKVPTGAIFWCEFDPEAHRHLFLFVRE